MPAPAPRYPAVTWGVEVLGTSLPLVQLPFLLHLDVSKLVSHRMSDPVSRGSQLLCQCLSASLPFPEPSPGLTLPPVLWPRLEDAVVS